MPQSSQIEVGATRIRIEINVCKGKYTDIFLNQFVPQQVSKVSNALL